MKIALTLIILGLSLVAAPFIANVLVRARPDETVEQAATRIGRRVVSAMVVTMASLAVMVGWLSDNNQDSNRAIALALHAIEENCDTQRGDWERTERSLISDVRLATAEYTIAVNDLTDLIRQRDEREVPDASALGPAAEAFVAKLYADGTAALEQRIVKATNTVSVFETELDTRQEDLDDLRANPVVCPPSALNG